MSSSELPPVKRLQAPLARGYFLAVLTVLVEWTPWLAEKLAVDSGLYALRKLDLVDFPTTYQPPDARVLETVSDEVLLKIPPREGPKNVPYLSYRDFHEAYKSKKVTPLMVAERVLSHLTASKLHTPPLNHVQEYYDDDVIEQARESTRRYAEGAWLSELDGVPILVKDEVDVKGCESRVGTSFINKGKPATEDATSVRRLRSKGAIIVGKSVMNEMGLDVFSINPIMGTPRNPFNPNHSCGGSSGGSAGAVAAGLVPFAIGTDSGGSVRIPASFCGVYGLKPTLGRISGVGTSPIGPTNCTQGPIAGSADDLALAYAIMAGPDEADSNSLNQPPPTLHNLSSTADLSDLRIGVYRAWNKQVTDPLILSRIESLEQSLRDRGATVVDIVIPELELARQAHVISLCSEVSAYLKMFARRELVQLTFPSRIIVALANTLTSLDYYRSLQIRTRIISHLRTLFQPSDHSTGIDFIMTPTTAITSPVFHPRDLIYGLSNQSLSSDAIRYIFLANFAGLPALSAPVGFDAGGMPIGAQFVAKWWDEAKLLRIARVCEELYVGGLESEKRRPGIWLGELL